MLHSTKPPYGHSPAECLLTCDEDANSVGARNNVINKCKSIISSCVVYATAVCVYVLYLQPKQQARVSVVPCYAM